ncbi:MAG: VWA domain-containing protein [Candidatus Tectomicrobia bacterium]|uniref:VWA domain-containing protein n=1 Tax=Tectimicrobiota bacterium TaxID=2528274 RepID=A0A937W012_UNCTE|nr:VWA domain-containing protein [Candidatus Tectomicrobia bacterium]
MFLDFFYTLRHHKIPVALTEWRLLMQALSLGFAHSSLERFYTLARSLLVKDVSYYDAYDLAFKEAFQGIRTPAEIVEEILAWLQEPETLEHLTPEQLALLEQLDLEALRELFAQRLREQRERHDRGNRMLGTGGTAPFGRNGQHPKGIRVSGAGGQRSAVQVATERQYENYRRDRTLDIRQMQVALKQLRNLKRLGMEEELDLDATIDQTCRNGGEIELIFCPPRKNNAKVLLLMDAGGSMMPYTTLVEGLFSAAHQATHFKDFQYYYFHNCIYEQLYTDIRMNARVSTTSLLHQLDADYKVILVGDAYMAPEELVNTGGALYYYHHNETPGLTWLRRIQEHFRSCIWLNPLPEWQWNRTTIHLVRQVFPMYALTLDGLDQGIKQLVRRVG